MIEFVDRPTSTRPKGEASTLLTALMETSLNGQAIVVPMESQNPYNVQARLRAWLNRRGYRMHYVRGSTPDRFIAWTEKKKKKGN